MPIAASTSASAPSTAIIAPIMRSPTVRSATSVLIGISSAGWNGSTSRSARRRSGASLDGSPVVRAASSTAYCGRWAIGR